MGSKSSILQKGLVLLAIPLIFQIILVMLVYRIRSENREAIAQLDLSTTLIRHANAPLALLTEAQSSLRGFLLTDQESFVDDMRAAAANALDELQTLRDLVVDENQVRSLGAIEVQVNRYLAWIDLVENLARTERRAQAHEEILSGQGVEGMRSVRETFMMFLAREENLMDAQAARVEKTWARLDQVLLLGLALLLSSTAFLATMFGRGMVARLAVLTENIHRLGGGRELVPPLKGRDELAQLDRTFREMADTLDRAALKERAFRDLLERRAEQLDQINRELEHKNRENELFVYSVSHDLRSPLVNLLGFSRELQMVGNSLRTLIDDPAVPEALRARGRDLVQEDMSESIHFIQQAVGRLSSIIDALLRLSRAGRVEYQSREVDVAGVVARITDALKGSLAEHNATVRVGDLPTAWADPSAVEQIFANLLINAVQYLDTARPGAIEVGSLGREGAHHIYFVRDNGIGIPEDYQEKVFDAFQRVHEATAPGEGIGLTLVKRVVDRLEGRIWVESQPGIGSTFSVALPVGSPESSPEPVLENLPAVTDLPLDIPVEDVAQRTRA